MPVGLAGEPAVGCQEGVGKELTCEEDCQIDQWQLLSAHKCQIARDPRKKSKDTIEEVEAYSIESLSIEQGYPHSSDWLAKYSELRQIVLEHKPVFHHLNRVGGQIHQQRQKVQLHDSQRHSLFDFLIQEENAICEVRIKMG